MIHLSDAQSIPLKQAVAAASALPLKLYPAHDMPMLKPWSGSVSHNPMSRNAIFSLNFPDHIFGMYNIASFLGSARKFHDGDIVLALPTSAPKDFLADIVQYDVVIYLLPMSFFEGAEKVPMFHFDNLPNSTAMPLAEIRYLMYQYWALKYHRKTTVLVSDFRDVFFQSNPFIYADNIWNSHGMCRNNPYRLIIYQNCPLRHSSTSNITRILSQ